MRKLIIAGNWKMNKGLNETRSFIQQVVPELGKLDPGRVIPLIAPAYPFLSEALREAFASPLQISAQNVSARNNGAFTGEVSASMLASMGLKYCIIGHSERRQYHGETDESVNQRLFKLLESGITPIVCIGETLEQRDAGETENVVISQLSGGLTGLKLDSGNEIIIAYEPVWAIGTGRTATPQQAQEVHALIRNWLKDNYGENVSENLSVLYGGSVKPDNIKELLECDDIDGGLIGGASLKETDFLAMVTKAIAVS